MALHPALTDHASQRAVERGQMAGVDMEPKVRLALAFAVKYRGQDIAVRLYRHGSEVGDSAGELDGRSSNGSDFWAVIRAGQVCTFMWRRAEQPITADRFGVAKVFAKGWAH